MNDLKSLYNNLSKSGLDFGTYEQFESDITTLSGARKAYRTLAGRFSPEEIGSTESEFLENLENAIDSTRQAWQKSQQIVADYMPQSLTRSYSLPTTADEMLHRNAPKATAPQIPFTTNNYPDTKVDRGFQGYHPDIEAWANSIARSPERSIASKEPDTPSYTQPMQEAFSPEKETAIGRTATAMYQYYRKNPWNVIKGSLHNFIENPETYRKSNNDYEDEELIPFLKDFLYLPENQLESSFNPFGNKNIDPELEKQLKDFQANTELGQQLSRYYTSIRPQTPNDQQTGFWTSFLGNTLERLGGETLNTIGGWINYKESIPRFIFANIINPENPGEILNDPNLHEKAYFGRKLMGLGNELVSRSDPNPHIYDPEIGQYRPRDFVDLFKEGNYAGAGADIYRAGVGSGPNGLVGAIPYAGPIISAISAANQKYYQLDTDPATKGLPEWQKQLNAAITGVIEYGTGKLGGKVISKVFKPMLAKMSKETVTDIVAKGGMELLVDVLMDGSEEALSQFGENTIDYFTGMTDTYDPFNNLSQAFGYGSANGMFSQGGKTLYSAGSKGISDIQAQKLRKNTTNEFQINDQSYYMPKNFADPQTRQQSHQTYNEVRGALSQQLGNDFDIVKSKVDKLAATDAALQDKASRIENMLNTSDFDSKQKQAIEKYAAASMANAEAQKVYKAEIQQAIDKQRQLAEKSINPTSDSYLTVQVEGIATPVQVRAGVALSPDGSVDYDKSHSQIHYIDQHGKEQPVHIDKVKSVVENIPAQQFIQQSMDQAAQSAVQRQQTERKQHYDLKDPVLINTGNDFVQGWVAKNKDPKTDTYQVVDNKKKQVKAHPNDMIDVRHMSGINNGSTVRYYDQQGNARIGKVTNAENWDSTGQIEVEGALVPIQRVISATADAADLELQRLKPEKYQTPDGDIDYNEWANEDPKKLARFIELTYGSQVAQQELENQANRLRTQQTNLETQKKQEHTAGELYKITEQIKRTQTQRNKVEKQLQRYKQLNGQKTAEAADAAPTDTKPAVDKTDISLDVLEAIEQLNKKWLDEFELDNNQMERPLPADTIPDVKFDFY